MTTELPFFEFPISYSEFAEKYLFPNKACVFGEWVTRDWPGRRDFTLPSGDVHVEKLKEIYGECENVSVSDCSSPSYGYDSAIEMKAADFLATWSSNNYLYWKDFHFQRDAPNYKPYEVPVYFKSDWLNEYWDEITLNGGKDDFRFIYAGPCGCWTPLHCDVIQSHSWSANLVGIKRWIMFEPGEMAKLEPFIREKQEADMDKFAQLASQVGARFVDFYQKPGEIVFVPSDWGHQVRNETDAVSLNHNWMNAFNAKFCFRYLENNWEQVRMELCQFGVNDSNGLEENIERIISASGGCSVAIFVSLISFIARRRLAEIDNLYHRKHHFESVQHVLKNQLEPGDLHHAILDLISIKTLIENSLLPFCCQQRKIFKSCLEKLLCDINTALE